MKILHVLHHSIPHVDGYCVRSAQIVRLQAEVLGWRPVVVTSSAQEPVPTKLEEQIEGINYYRILNPNNAHIPYLKQLLIIRQLKKRLNEVICQEAPDLIHAHSPSLCGLAAISVGRKHRIPVVYEVRAFWEDSIFDRGQNPNWSLRYRISRWLEMQVLRRANAVATIAENMRLDLIDRGIDRRKLFVTPNGVETERFEEPTVDRALQSDLCITDQTVFGYVGSLYGWEGVDVLIRAMHRVATQNPNCKLVIVGGGEEEAKLRRLVDDLGMQEAVKLVGRVPHNEVIKYYSIMDVLVYPRNRSRTTELVTPLKPLEAQAMGKPLMASDVGGLVELTGGKGTIFFRSGNELDLANKCLEFVGLSTDERLSLGEEGKAHALQNRDWKKLIHHYKPFYSHAILNGCNGLSSSDSVRKSEAGAADDH